MSDSEEIAVDLFQEPDGYFKERKAASQTMVERGNGEKIVLDLAPEHSLWGHVLWNASRVILNQMDEGIIDVRGKRVLELGSGAGLASIASCLNGAAAVYATDYPDEELIERLQTNINRNTKDTACDVHVAGFAWGSDTAPLLADGLFDVIILSDLLFNHSQHGALLRTCRECLAPGGVVRVAFSSHRPWLQHKDLAFFDLAVDRTVVSNGECCFAVTELDPVRMPVMFEEDPGDIEIRRTVKIYIMELVE
ncbi:Nicotinamide N-methyltransferase-like [Carpediemonas membranifera]|uniref:Nicotinamide N-methyltransferase-like n=1 Tax=Carpediemonas membranifera TaxID=201153 RepID=A0A8J6B3W3_9EUKA|nr:Nicotinamide N-methyltransferase-like [Carpediemonas membranifera]|eukprot:KAG9395163.1 Nicotinamide N-methyltransferase-like [Carpediemonas membranifera]